MKRVKWFMGTPTTGEVMKRVEWFVGTQTMGGMPESGGEGELMNNTIKIAR